MKARLPILLALTVALLVGVLLGQLVPGPKAAAQGGPRAWRECYGASIFTHGGHAINNAGFRPNAITIPAGWIPVGGDTTAVVLCR